MTSTKEFNVDQQGWGGLAGMLMFSVLSLIMACASLFAATDGSIICYSCSWVFGWLALGCLFGTIFGNANVAGYTLIAGIVTTISIIGGYLIWEYALGWIWDGPWIDADTCPAGMVYNGHHDVYDDGTGCALTVGFFFLIWKAVETCVLVLAVVACDFVAATLSYEGMFGPIPE